VDAHDRQIYVICPSEKRLLLLFTFLKKNRKKKVMVFSSSCMSVKYHNELFNYIDLSVMCIHGKQKQTKRTTTFFQFCNADSGILLCTDVAARGLDIPDVDWIVQFDPPDDPKEYIHRVGRTARAGRSGKSITLVTQYDVELYQRIEELIGKKLPAYEMEHDEVKVLQERVSEAQRYARTEMKDQEQRRKMGRKRGPAGPTGGAGGGSDDEISSMTKKKIFSKSSKKKRR
jgi:superfamily II DNA/RNA helicase